MTRQWLMKPLSGFGYSFGGHARDNASHAAMLLALLFLAACAAPPVNPAPAPPAAPPTAVIPLPSATPLPPPTPTPTPGLIRPGEIIDVVLVTTGSEQSTFAFDLPCKPVSGGGYRCPAPCGKAVNPLAVVYNRELQKLNEAWETLEYSATINGRAVDLPAFGLVETKNEQSGVTLRT